MDCSIYVIPVSKSETLGRARHANIIVVIKVNVILNTFSNRWEGDLWFRGNIALQVNKLLEML